VPDQRQCACRCTILSPGPIGTSPRHRTIQRIDRRARIGGWVVRSGSQDHTRVQQIAGSKYPVHPRSPNSVLSPAAVLTDEHRLNGCDTPRCVSLGRSLSATIEACSTRAWVKGKHTFGFGGNLRIITNNRNSDANSFSFARSYDLWLNPTAFIAGTGADGENGEGTRTAVPSA